MLGGLLAVRPLTPQPIAHALTDGTEYLLFHPELRRWMVGAYDEGHHLPGWYSDTVRTFGTAETGPLPEPERFWPRWFCELPAKPVDA